MAFDDLKLIFETERRILERRLKEFLPSRVTSTPPSPPRPATRGKIPPDSPPRNEGKPKKFRRHRASSLVWIFSVGFHAVILAIALPHWERPVPPKRAEVQFSVNLVARVKPRTPDPQPPAPQAQTPTTPEIVEEEEVAETPPTPVPTEVETPTVEPTVDPPAEPAPAIIGQGGGGTPGRSKIGARSGEKAQALRVFGGGSETEVAVTAGLKWLGDHQEGDGSWSASGFTRCCPAGRPCGGAGNAEYGVGVSALALLAFLGAGIDGEQEHPHAAKVRKGLEWLLSVQDSRGCFGEREGNYMYNHAIATFCMAEAALLTEREDYRRGAEEGLEFSSRSQQPGGGWDYQAARTLRNDISITGWQVMAIHTARNAEIPFPSRMETRLFRYLGNAVHKNGWATYADRGMGADRGGIAVAAVGLLSKLYMGWSPRSAELQRGAELIVNRPPSREAAADWQRTFQSSYYWYYATLSLFHLGGERWEAWNSYMKRELLPLQHQQGHRKGSWDPDPNWIGSSGGRIATTAFNLLSFEVYYRYKPLYLKYALDRDPSNRAGTSEHLKEDRR